LLKLEEKMVNPDFVSFIDHRWQCGKCKKIFSPCSNNYHYKDCQNCKKMAKECCNNKNGVN